MSFGWSAGDIFQVLKLLCQISVALKDSGGASSNFQDTFSFLQTLSRTLQHLNALQSVPLDPEVSEGLKEQCNHIKEPLETFLADVGRRFEPALGAQSKRSSFLAAPQKVQWALSTKKKVKSLQDRIAVPMAAVGMILGQQIIQTTLKMPDDIQKRMEHVINMRASPETNMIAHKLEAMSAAQATSADFIARSFRSLRQNTSLDIDGRDIEGQEGVEGVEDLRRRQESEHTFQKEYIEGIHKKLDHLSSVESDTAGATVRFIQETYREAKKEHRLQALESREHCVSLHRKLDQVDASIGYIRHSLEILSDAQEAANLDDSTAEIEEVAGKILVSVWLLLSNLQLLIRKLVILLAPCLFALYRTTMQRCLQYGDHFLFEDAIGRKKSLPCDQFQHWDIFYTFLLASFEDTLGLSMVVKKRFLVINQYNSCPISPEAWQTAIQPRSKIIMAMKVENRMAEGDVQAARPSAPCPDTLCSGVIESTAKVNFKTCLKCGKHVMVDIESGGTVSNDHAFSDASSDVNSRKADNGSDTSIDEEPFAPSTSELAAFKRVWATILVISSKEDVDDSSHNHIINPIRSTYTLSSWLGYNEPNLYERIRLDRTREEVEMLHGIRGMQDCLPVASKPDAQNGGNQFIGWRKKLAEWPFSSPRIESSF